MNNICTKKAMSYNKLKNIKLQQTYIHKYKQCISEIIKTFSYNKQISLIEYNS